MKNIIFRMVAIVAIFAFSASGRADSYYFPQSSVLKLWAQGYMVSLVVGVDDGSGEQFFTALYGEGQVKVKGITGYTFIVENFHFADAVNEFETIQNNIMGTVSALEESTAYKAAFWAESYSKNNQAMSLAMSTAFMKVASYSVPLADTEEMSRAMSDITALEDKMNNLGNGDKIDKLVEELGKRLSGEIEEAEEKASDAAESVGTLENEVSSLEDRVTTTETNMSELQARIESKSNEKTALEGWLESVEATTLSLQETSSYLSEQVELLTAQKDAYELDKEETEGKITANTTKIGELTSQITTLNAMKQGASDTEIEILQGLIDLNTLDIQALQSDNVTLNSKISTLNTSISRVNTSIADTNTKVATLAGKITEAENKQTQLQGDISAAEEQMELDNERITELSDEISNLRDEMNEKMEDLKTEMQTLKGALAKAAVTKVTQEIVNKTENFFPVAGVSVGDIAYTNAMIELSKYMGNANPTNGGVAFDAPTRGEGGEKFTGIDEYLNWKGVTVAVTNQNSEYGMAFVLGSNRFDSVTAPFGAPENWVAEGGGIVVTNGQYRVMFGGAWSYADGGFMGCTVQMGSIGWHQSFMPYSAIGDVYAVITYSDVDNPSVTLSATPVNVRGETISIWVGTLVSDGNGGVRARSTRNSPITIIMYE